MNAIIKVIQKQDQTQKLFIIRLHFKDIFEILKEQVPEIPTVELKFLVRKAFLAQNLSDHMTGATYQGNFKKNNLLDLDTEHRTVQIALA